MIAAIMGSLATFRGILVHFIVASGQHGIFVDKAL